MASSPITSWQIDREIMEKVTNFIFLGLKITMDSDCSYEIKRHLQKKKKKTFAPVKESYDKPRQCVEQQRHYFADKDPHSQSFVFPSSHVQV